jgi:hypothetical protein
VFVRLVPVVAEMEPDLELGTEAADFAPADRAAASKILRWVATPFVASDRELLPAVADMIELQGMKVHLPAPGVHHHEPSWLAGLSVSVMVEAKTFERLSCLR